MSEILSSIIGFILGLFWLLMILQYSHTSWGLSERNVLKIKIGENFTNTEVRNVAITANLTDLFKQLWITWYNYNYKSTRCTFNILQRNFYLPTWTLNPSNIWLVRVTMLARWEARLGTSCSVKGVRTWSREVSRWGNIRSRHCSAYRFTCQTVSFIGERMRC